MENSLRGKQSSQIDPAEALLFESDQAASGYSTPTQKTDDMEYTEDLKEAVATLRIQNQETLKGDPLLPLVLGKGPVTSQNHGEHLKLLENLVDTPSSSSDTRSRCMRILITSTREWKTCIKDTTPVKDTSSKTEPLHWTVEFIEILKGLLKAGADPAWSLPDSYGSNLHVFMMVVPQVFVSNNQLYTQLLELVDMMMTEKAVDCNNVDSDKGTILHALVDGNKKMLIPAHADKLGQIVSRIKAKNPALLDAQNNSSCTPLHTFLSCFLQKDLTAEYASEWFDQSFLEVVRYLISPKNIDIINDNSDTALHIFSSMGGRWQNNLEVFSQVVNCLKSPFNINMKNNKGEIPLCPSPVLSKHLELTSENKSGYTPLHTQADAPEVSNCNEHIDVNNKNDISNNMEHTNFVSSQSNQCVHNPEAGKTSLNSSRRKCHRKRKVKLKRSGKKDCFSRPARKH